MEHKLEFDEEFKSICRQIVLEDHTIDEWREIESCDSFQSAHFCGGYDADEDAFCFSYFDDKQQEWWFQLTLVEVQSVFAGEITQITARKAE